jgi:lactoylglutathione lyase
MTKFAYSIVFVSDMARSVAFYRDLIGLKLRMESPEWSEFETGGCTLALHKSPGGVSPKVEEGKIPAAHCHPGFNVEDIDAFAARMEQAGVAVMQPVKREEFGARMGAWRDPDGLPVTVLAFDKR